MCFFIYSIPFSKLSVHQRTEQRETGSFPVFSSAAQYSIIKGIELGEVTCKCEDMHSLGHGKKMFFHCFSNNTGGQTSFWTSYSNGLKL